MTKILIKFSLVLFVLLVIAYGYIGFSVWKQGRDEDVLRREIYLV